MRGKGLIMTVFNKVFKLTTKPNSSLKISHLYKNQIEILTTKIKYLGRKMTIYDMLLSFLLLRDEFIKKNTSIFSHTAEGKRRGHSY